MLKDGKLRCDWRNECERKVAYIGEKGYVYCAKDVGNRAGFERTRRLTKDERAKLERGERLASFEARS